MMSEKHNIADTLIRIHHLPEFNVNLNDLPKIESSNYRLLWFDDFYDGDINGILLYQNKKYWYQIYSESDDEEYSDYYRRYIIIELTELQISEEEYWHTLFQEKVGYPVATQPQEMWSEFYEPNKSRKHRDFSKNIVIGWFETK
jgi:hypothetical protein